MAALGVGHDKGEVFGGVSVVGTIGVDVGEGGDGIALTIEGCSIPGSLYTARVAP